MKKLVIISFFLLIGNLSINAQKNIQAYFGVNQSIGYSFGNTKLEADEYSGLEAGRKKFKVWGLSKKKIPLSTGFQVEGGIILKERLMIGTGIKYLYREQQGVFYCHVCDLFITEASNMSSYFLEIPLRLQLNLIEDRNIFPTVSSELYWSKAYELENVNFLGYKFGIGVARKIGRHLLTLESQFNKSLVDKEEYPNYYMQEIQLNIRWTFSLF